MRAARGARRPLGLAAVVLLLVAACAGTKSTQSGGGGDGGFEGETVRIVVPFGPGGSYDIIARAAAPYLEEELGATVVVENNDGAGGLVAANEVFAAEPDGLTIGFFSAQGIAGANLGAAEGAQFDVLDYSYVGRISVDIGSGTVSSRLPDIKAGELRPLLIVGDEPVDKLPGVPVVTELDLAADDRAMAEAHLRSTVEEAFESQ